MAKRKRSTSASSTSRRTSKTEPDVDAAKSAVERAREELKKAEQLFEQARDAAAKRMQKVGEASVGDLVDATLQLVRKHPGASIVTAGIVGVLLGRLFRR